MTRVRVVYTQKFPVDIEIKIFFWSFKTLEQEIIVNFIAKRKLELYFT